ncbi:MAG: ABC transporter ATP-binding protein [Dehalococcoidia bacterium]|nr:ABC transporter ATP-binding protein [Dehalococcoidia bacterium]
MAAIAAATPLLAARGVTVELGGQPVLRGVDLEVRAGEVVGLLGPNGAGKSTFLRAATRLVPLSGGSLEVEGTGLERITRRDLARAVAVVQQLPEAPGTMLVEELVLLGRNPHLGLLSRESPHDYAVAVDAMRRVGCEEFARRPLHTLSGGQRRRAFLARALAQEPRLLLLDEPNANLDVQAQAEAFELLLALARDGVGVLVAVHDLTLAAAYCDRVVMLVEGRVIASGAPADVVTSEVVARVYGDRVMVIPHPQSGAPIVVPAVMERSDA